MSFGLSAGGLSASDLSSGAVAYLISEVSLQRRFYAASFLAASFLKDENS